MKLKPKVKPPQTAGVTLHSPLFTAIQRPDFADTLKFPSNISTLSPANVSELHGKYTLLYSYANQEWSRNQRQHLIEKTEEERLFLVVALNDEDYKKARDAKTKEVHLQKYENFRKVKERLRQLHIERITIEMWLKNFEMYIASLSRELSRKVHDEGNYRGQKI